MHEIVTIQLGQRANYLATHYWNTQESYQSFAPSPPSLVDHDISFRSGIGADGAETYMPRTVIYDLKGGFGSMKRINELYELEADAQGRSGVWKGPTTLQTAPLIQSSPYIASLATTDNPSRPTISTVKYWSDFSHLYYHPRSIVQLNDYSLGSSLHPFENYTSGDELFDTLDEEHDLLDRDVRLWAEECDHMQGIQFFSGADDAWAGFAARYIERVRDEFGKLRIWAWGIEGNSTEGRKEKQILRTINTARALHDISAQASLYIPITTKPRGLPTYVSMDHTSEWHTSALLAAAIDSVTLSTRLRGDDQNRVTFNNLEAALNTNENQQIAQLQFSVRDPRVLQELRHKKSKQHGPAPQDSRMPSAHSGHALPREDSSLGNNQGLGDLDINLMPDNVQINAFHAKTSHNPVHVFGRIDSLRGPFDDNGGLENAEEEEHQSSLQFELLDTFPNIFPDLSATGSVAVSSSLSTTTAVAKRVLALRVVVGQMVGLEEREALSNGLGEIAEAYEEGWSSGSDDGSDD